MQHDWLQGPAIDGGACNLRDDSAGKKFIVLHGRQRRAGRERSHLGTLAGRWGRNGPIGSVAFAFTEGPAKPAASPQEAATHSRARKVTPLSFDRERAPDFAVGTTHLPGGHNEQWNHGQDQGRYQ
jgi:hypothetical protein